MGFLMPALGLMIRTLPYRILSYYPLRNRIRFPLWVVVLMIGSTELIEMFLYGYAVSMGGSGRSIELLFGPICMATYFICIKADCFRLLFLYLFFTDYLMMVWGLAAFISSRLFFVTGALSDEFWSMGLHLVLFAVTAPCMIWFLSRIKDLVFRIEAPALWHTIWLIPAFTSVIVLLFTGGFRPEEAMQWKFLIARVFLLLSMFVVFYILLYSLGSIQKQAVLAERASRQEQTIALQQAQYVQMQKTIEATRTARHDLRQHLRVIQAFLDHGDKDALKDYIASYRAELPMDTGESYCKNYAVDVLVRYYAEEAGRHHVSFSARMDLPEVLPVREPEFCAMLGNLLENALEACKSQTEQAPYIVLNAGMNGHCISVTVDNSCAAEPRQQDGHFLSSKHEGYGTGTISVQSTAERYDGVSNFVYKNGVFSASVLLTSH